jgi:hypothetical protein
MAIQTLTFNRLSDLVLVEDDNLVRTQRKAVTLNLSSAELVKLGQIVYRAKGTDPTAVYNKVSASGQLVTTNEFAVVIGNGLEYKESFNAPTSGYATTPAVAITNGFGAAVILRNTLPDALLTAAGLTAGNIATLKLLLENQGIFFATDL